MLSILKRARLAFASVEPHFFKKTAESNRDGVLRLGVDTGCTGEPRRRQVRRIKNSPQEFRVFGKRFCALGNGTQGEGCRTIRGFRERRKGQCGVRTGGGTAVFRRRLLSPGPLNQGAEVAEYGGVGYTAGCVEKIHDFSQIRLRRMDLCSGSTMKKLYHGNENSQKVANL